MDMVISQFINGLSYSMLLFMIASGLSLVFGILGVLNLAHGSLYMIGAYLALTLTNTLTSNFWVALLIAPVLVAVIGLIIEVGLLRPTYHLGLLPQVLLTFGLAYVIHDLVRWIWGSNILSLSVPSLLSGSVDILGFTFPIYRLAVMVFGVAVAIVMWVFQEKTMFGAIIRAGLSNREMVSGLGINVKVVFSVVFVIGSLLAGMGGVVAGPILGLFPDMEFEILILSLVVLVVGGLGTVAGPFIASIIIGLATTYGNVYIPQFAMFVTFAVMALVLIFRPQGLLGKKVIE